MKFAWMKEEERLIPVKAYHKGAVRDFLLHHLTDADTDEAERRYPLQRPPQIVDEAGKVQRDPQGRPLLDLNDAAYIGAAAEAHTNRYAYLAVVALGPECFDARDIDAMMVELRRSGDGFSWATIRAIADAALADAALTPEKMEAAKQGVAPFESPAADATKGT